MKISILQENLLKTIQDAVKIVPTKPQIPILACFLLEAKEGQLHISATDLLVGMRLVVGCKVEKPGEIAVPARVLCEYVSTLRPGTLNLEVEESTLSIAAGQEKTKIQAISPKEYPPFPAEKGKPITIEKEKLIELIEYGGVAAGIDETRPVFSSMYLEIGGGEMAVVSTDGYRLSKKSLHIQSDATATVLLSAKTLREASRVIGHTKGETVEITIAEELGQVFFSADDVKILVRMIEGSFPAYTEIVPAEFSIELTCAAEELARTIKAAMVFSRESSGIVKIAISAEGIRVTSASASLGTYESVVPAELKKGESGEMALNGKYIQDILSIAGAETVSFGMNESLKPGMFRIEGQKDFYYVIMPFRVQ